MGNQIATALDLAVFVFVIWVLMVGGAKVMGIVSINVPSPEAGGWGGDLGMNASGYFVRGEP